MSRALAAGAEQPGSRPFIEASERHRVALADRGYEIEAQLDQSFPFLQNSPWKTYWRARHRELGEVFVKINYGYSAAVNVEMGQKEALLPGHFSNHYRDLPGVAFPRVVDYWEAGGAFAVAVVHEELTSRALSTLMENEGFVNLFLEFLDRWSRIEPPDWWDRRYVLHDFAEHADFAAESRELAPFGFDLDDNLRLDGEGRLFFFDFEFIQWTSRWLQQLFIALKLLQGRRQCLAALRGRGLAALLIEQAATASPKVLEQATVALRAKLARDDKRDLRSRLAARSAVALARRRMRLAPLGRI